MENCLVIQRRKPSSSRSTNDHQHIDHDIIYNTVRHQPIGVSLRGFRVTLISKIVAWERFPEDVAPRTLPREWTRGRCLGMLPRNRAGGRPVGAGGPTGFGRATGIGFGFGGGFGRGGGGFGGGGSGGAT